MSNYQLAVYLDRLGFNTLMFIAAYFEKDINKDNHLRDYLLKVYESSNEKGQSNV